VFGWFLWRVGKKVYQSIFKLNETYNIPGDMNDDAHGIIPAYPTIPDLALGRHNRIYNRRNDIYCHVRVAYNG
jgi:hypothetical protein